MKSQNRKPNRASKKRSQRNKGIPKSCPCSGVLEMHPKGYGFLRQTDKRLTRCEDDVFVSESIIKKFGLRSGALIEGLAQQPDQKAGPRLVKVQLVENQSPEVAKSAIPFEDRMPRNPSQWLRLEHPDQPISMRVLDMLTPIGLGQRALIAAAPRSGKTSLLKQIGRSLALNYPDLKLMALLIDERPEEVTDFTLEIDEAGTSVDVFASSLDSTVSNHVRLSQLVIDRCHRIAEQNQNVVLLIDSLTRMGRAFNKHNQNSGAIGAGGLNIRALDIPRQIFASARPFAGGGSLTVIATVLIETENRMDDVIFREFKGTGNLDLVLSQEIADRCIWPAIDISKSKTRRVELLQNPETLQSITLLRNTLLSMNYVEAMKELTDKLSRFKTNHEFLAAIRGVVR